MTLDPLKHRALLIKILKEIYSDPELGPVMGFKGGTAAFLFYGLNRFSVDLDFDLLDRTKLESVFILIKNLLAKYGMVKIADKKRYSLIFILSYNEKDPGAQNIKVEINLRDFGSKFQIKSFLGIPMLVMRQDDMFANKLVAFYERIGKTNRDIYDTWFFFSKDWSINRDLVERRTGMTYQTFLEKCISMVENTDNRRILSGMGELMDEKQKAWVKTNLKQELLFQLRVQLKGIELNE